MIDFTHVGDFSRWYRLCMNYVELSHDSFFYHNIYIVGKDNIPQKGTPLFAFSNHQNALMDAMALLNMFKDGRQPVFIARGDIFKKDAIAKIFRFLKIMPTFRTRDGGRRDIMYNNVTFDMAEKVLHKGGTMIMFPEAAHQHGRYLSTFKKGFPRICFAAEERADFNLQLQMLPVCLHYSHYEHCCTELLIIIGKPFTFEELFELYKTEPNNAYLALNDKARKILKEMVIDIEDQEHYQEYDLLRTLIAKNRLAKQKRKYTFYEQFQEERKVVSDIDELKKNSPDKFDALMTDTKNYLTGLKEVRLRDFLIGKKVSLFSLFFRKLCLILLFPFYLFAFINNAIPYYLPELLVKKFKDRQFHSSARYLSGFLIFPVFYLILFAVVWIFSSFLFAAAYILATAFMLKLIYFYKVAVIKFWHTWRYYLLKNKPSIQRLIKLKENILIFFL